MSSASAQSVNRGGDYLMQIADTGIIGRRWALSRRLRRQPGGVREHARRDRRILQHRSPVTPGQGPGPDSGQIVPVTGSG